MRSSEKLFKDLVNMTADKWNAKLSTELGISIDMLRNSIMNKESLTNDEDKISFGLSKPEITRAFYESDDDNGEFTPKSISKFVIRMNDGDPFSDAIACTGKYLIGMDFRGSDLSGSYFCDCVMFNCDFSQSEMKGVTFTGCIFNACAFSNSDLSETLFLKGKIIDSVFDYCSWQRSVIHDTIMISSQFMFIDLSQSTITASGMIQCIASSSTFKDTKFVHFSSSISDFSGSDFRGVKLIDSVFTDTNFKSCNFSKYSATCITAARVELDPEFESVFEMSHALYSPSVFEWEIEDIANDRDSDDLEASY